MAGLMTSMGFHEMVIPALLFLILVALLFPGLLRAVFFMIGLFALYTIGIANRAHEARAPELTESEQADVSPAPETTIPIPHTATSLPRWQEVRTPSGAYLCRNGQAWSVGLCPPHRP